VAAPSSEAFITASVLSAHPEAQRAHPLFCHEIQVKNERGWKLLATIGHAILSVLAHVLRQAREPHAADFDCGRMGCAPQRNPKELGIPIPLRDGRSSRLHGIPFAYFGAWLGSGCSAHQTRRQVLETGNAPLVDRIVKKLEEATSEPESDLDAPDPVLIHGIMRGDLKAAPLQGRFQ
jgi:hypothetical protein